MPLKNRFYNIKPDIKWSRLWCNCD